VAVVGLVLSLPSSVFALLFDRYVLVLDLGLADWVLGSELGI